MSMRTGTTSSNSMARNSQAFAPRRGSRILPLYISCIPDKRIGESKSLKRYLFSCRNHGAFHEDCVNMIMDDLIQLPDPRYIEVWGLPARGGLSIDPCCNYGRPGTEWKDMARYRLLRHDRNPEMVDNR